MKPKQRLLSYLKKNPNKHMVKGDILRVAQEKLSNEGRTMYDETLGRYLRELAEEGSIKRYTNKKGFVVYYYEPSEQEKFHQQMQLL